MQWFRVWALWPGVLGIVLVLPLLPEAGYSSPLPQLSHMNRG